MSAGRYVTLKELAEAGVPGWPSTRRRWQDYAERHGWAEARDLAGKPLARPRAGRGGGLEYCLSLLPPAVAARFAAVEPAPEPGEAERERLWTDFSRASAKRRAEARRRVAVLDDVARLRSAGHGRTAAVQAAARKHGAATSTIYVWLMEVEGQRRDDWAPCLLPRHRGCTATAECSADAWDWFVADYLRPERPSMASCYRRLRQVAADRGWLVPALMTLRRRFEREVPREEVVLARDGEKALLRLYPAQQRDPAEYHAGEAFNIDGHQFNTWVEFSDGEVKRPVVEVVQDVYSRYFVAWRVDKTENAELVRLTLGDAFEVAIPTFLFSDNGRAVAAKSISGGQKTRFRGKVKEDDLSGVLTLLGITVRWTKPAWGQSRPVERSFRDLCDDIARGPRLAGAYAGSTPADKPDYKVKPVSLDTFMQALAEGFAELNARTGRRTATAQGRSVEATWRESYERSAPRKATAAQRRWCLLAAERVKVRPDATVYLFENRYHDQTLYRHKGAYVTLRYDPDDLHAGVYVQSLDGADLCFAEAIAKTGFGDRAAAQEHGRALRRFRKTTRANLEARRKLTAAELAADLPARALPPPPEANVVTVSPDVPTPPPLSARERELQRQVEADLAGAGRPDAAAEAEERAWGRALELERRLDRGETIDDGDAAWLARYRQTSKYRTRKARAEHVAEFEAALAERAAAGAGRRA